MVARSWRALTKAQDATLALRFRGCDPAICGSDIGKALFYLEDERFLVERNNWGNIVSGATDPIRRPPYFPSSLWHHPDPGNLPPQQRGRPAVSA